MYRIACKFEPQHPRMAGKCATGHAFTRGAWRVVDCWPKDDKAPDVAHQPYWSSIGIVSHRPARKGTLINPRKVVNSYLSYRRANR